MFLEVLSRRVLRHNRATVTRLLTAALVCFSACATVTPLPLSRVPVTDTDALHAIAEKFYRANTPQELTATVREAQALAPDAALTHELASRLAWLEGRRADEFNHLVRALRDTGDDAALLHLHQLNALDWNFEQREQVEALCASLAASHPDARVRAVAANMHAALLGPRGDFDGRDRALAAIPGQLELAFVGTWDNDQGKGFDLDFEPERKPELNSTYEGRAGTLTWRRDVPRDSRGRYELLQLMWPSRFMVAFAQGTVVAEQPGLHALYVTTSDPLKVWVDGKLVFSEAQLDRSVVDHIVIPVELTAGPHTVLFKSAHREGAWNLAARVTPLDGESFAPGLASLLAWRVRELPKQMPARKAAHYTMWAHYSAGGLTTVRAADASVNNLPDSLMLRAWLIEALWFNQERGRTADLLSALDAEVGDALPFIRLRQARFHQQQGLKLKARERLRELQRDKPHLYEAWDLLADVYRTEGWVEDELKLLRERRARFGDSTDELLDLARALARQGHRAEAHALVDEALRTRPFHGEVLRRKWDLALEEQDDRSAIALMRRRLEAHPTDTSVWLALSDAQRRLRDYEGALASAQVAEKLNPEAPAALNRMGNLAYEQGDLPGALKAWRRSLELHPENESLANRVEFLAPEQRGEWMADVPTETKLEALVRSREALRHKSGADYAYLLDHQVTLLNNDGSTVNVITLVAHAFNAAGRDRIIRQQVGAGRLRVLHAWAIDDKGQRSEASSERNRQIFFRGMQPGSTLVLQYRLDTPPRGYLARYYNESWSFQGVSDQREEATFVLWAPLATKLHEYKVGQLAHTQEKRGELLRFSWSLKDTEPLISEPSMPTVGELAVNLNLSSVPDWKTWLSWEQALLEGVFRDSPQLDAVAKQLGEGGPGTEEKLARIHTFVMEEIRYQQDYETFIAGVKPHPASMTLERRYGDCKDKAVLFIELARKLGLDAHFALVRTRDKGPVRRDVPMQQFNHAIVYVPEQHGVAARFFDPTAELLDVTSVRSDDVGTLSLVFDPKTNAHAWREVSFQQPEDNRETTTLKLQLDVEGGVRGEATVEGVGRTGSLLRRTARNEQVFTQVAQRVAASYVPNATAAEVKAVEVNSLRAPAVIAMKLSSSTFARTEDSSLRVKLPGDVNPRNLFSLATRRHPLVLGTPQQQSMHVELTLPDGFDVARLPKSGGVTLPCLSLTREVKQEGRVVKSSQTYRTLCERITPAEYQTYRGKLDDMVRLLDDELVLSASKKQAVPAAKKK